MGAGVANAIFFNLWKNFLSIMGAITRCFKRMVCRSRRGRKNSGSLLPLTNVKVTGHSDVQHSVPSNEVEMQSWDSWGPDDNGFGPQAPVEPRELDFFQDMTPDYKRAAKIMVRKKEESVNHGMSSRLAFTSDVPAQSGGIGDLGTWDEGENAWAAEVGEDLSWEAQEAIKDRKRLDREQRHVEQQRKKLMKETAKQKKDGAMFHAVKLS